MRDRNNELTACQTDGLLQCLETPPHQTKQVQRGHPRETPNVRPFSDSMAAIMTRRIAETHKTQVHINSPISLRAQVLI